MWQGTRYKILYKQRIEEKNRPNFCPYVLCPLLTFSFNSHLGLCLQGESLRYYNIFLKFFFFPMDDVGTYHIIKFC